MGRLEYVLNIFFWQNIVTLMCVRQTVTASIRWMLTAMATLIWRAARWAAPEIPRWCYS